MSRRRSANETARMVKAKRDIALARNELRTDRIPHTSATGPTSGPIKLMDPDIQRMIADYRNRQGAR